MAGRARLTGRASRRPGDAGRVVGRRTPAAAVRSGAAAARDPVDGRAQARPGTPAGELATPDAEPPGFPPGATPARRLLRRLRGVRWARVLVLGAAALVVALVLGVTTASVEQSFGPHEARYSVTTDDLVTLDLGPLGTLQIDSPLPLTLGARVTVEEIPAGVTAVDPARTVQALGQDLQSYIQFFTGPRATIEDAGRALALDAGRRTLLAFSGLLVLGALLGALLGPTRRRELARALAPHRGDIGRAAGVALVVAVTCVSSVGGAARPGDGDAASPVFDGTALEGARITGRLSGVIDTYGSVVVGAYRRNEAFYDAAQAAVAAAWDRRALAQQTLGPATSRAGGGPDGDVAPGSDAAAGAGNDAAAAAGDGAAAGDDAARAAEDAVGAGAGPGAEPGDEAGGDDSRAGDSVEPTLEPVEPVVIVLVSDLHCNIGMARIIRTVAERSGADLVLNAGDTTVNGTSVERYCITTFAQAVPRGVAKVVVDGNHDSLETAEHERAAGWTVLDGDVVTAAGVRILGDRDPNQTRIGGGTAQVSAETAAVVGQRLAQTACRARDVDILLIHTPRVGDAALRSGCVPVQLSGHQHRHSDPVQVGEGFRYVLASTAGAAPNAATIGPLNGVAELTVLRFDPGTRRMLDTQLVEVTPDGSATVGTRVPWPVLAPTAPNVPLLEGGGEGTGVGVEVGDLGAGAAGVGAARPASDDDDAAAAGTTGG